MNAAASSKIQLVLQVLRDHFGNIVHDVSAFIMNCEDCTLLNMYRHFGNLQSKDNKLSVNQIREALAALLHHNCLLAEISSQQDEEIEITSTERLNHAGLIYNIDEEMVLNRLYFPVALQAVSRGFGLVAAAICQEIMIESRLKYDDIDTLVNANMNPDLKKQPDVSIQSTFQLLVTRRLLIPVGELDITRRAKSKESRASAMFSSLGTQRNGPVADAVGAAVIKPSAKRKRAALKAVEESADELPLELRMMLENDQGKKPIVVDEMKDNDEPADKMTKISFATTIVPEKVRGRQPYRKNSSPSTSSSSSLSSAMSDSNVDLSASSPPPSRSSKSDNQHDKLWTINWDQIIREERHHLCIQITHTRMEKFAGEVVRVLLDGSMMSETSPTQEFSASMTISQIHEKVKSMKGPRVASNLDIAILKKILDLLRADALGIVNRVEGITHNDADTVYYVNMGSLIAYAKRKAIHDIASTRYDTQSSRILELLQRRRYLEQQELADLVILPARDVRERLYRLYKDKWVEFYEFSKRNDFNPSSTYYFWYVDHRRLDDAVLNNMYKAVLNLRIRIKFEGDKHAGNVASETSSDQHGKIMDRLELSQFKVFKTIFLLSKF